MESQRKKIITEKIEEMTENYLLENVVAVRVPTHGMTGNECQDFLRELQACGILINIKISERPKYYTKEGFTAQAFEDETGEISLKYDPKKPLYLVKNFPEMIDLVTFNSTPTK